MNHDHDDHDDHDDDDHHHHHQCQLMWNGVKPLTCMSSLHKG